MSRGVSHRETKEVETLFSQEEWLEVLERTCKGLLKLDLPTSSDRITYLVFCTINSAKFKGTLELVCVCVGGWLGVVHASLIW